MKNIYTLPVPKCKLIIKLIYGVFGLRNIEEENIVSGTVLINIAVVKAMDLYGFLK